MACASFSFLSSESGGSHPFFLPYFTLFGGWFSIAPQGFSKEWFFPFLFLLSAV